MFLILVLSTIKVIKLYFNCKEDCLGAHNKELKKIIGLQTSKQKTYLFYLGISFQVAYLIILLYTTYPVTLGRANYYLALKIAASITTICASLTITNKTSSKSKKVV